MSAPQYFRLANCNRTIKSDGLYFQFDACYCSGGRWIGVFATADEKQIAAASKIPGVEIVSQESYLDTLKKKPAGQPTLNPLLDMPDGKSPLAQQDARLVVEAEVEVVRRVVARPERPEPPKEAPSIDSVLAVEPVLDAPPAPVAAPVEDQPAPAENIVQAPALVSLALTTPPPPPTPSKGRRKR